jgi:hypothetical protein
MLNNGITQGTPKKILFGAGVYFKGVPYNEETAPTEEVIKAAIIGATQEGGTLTITPEFFAPELDGALVAIRELQKKIGETAIMEVSFAELSAELMKNQVIGKLGATTDNKYEVVTSDDQVRPNHFYEGFGYYGTYFDGRPMIILFKNALCTSGFTTDSKNKTNSVFKGTFTCMSDLEYGVTRLPYVIFMHNGTGWVAVNADEAAAAAQ